MSHTRGTPRVILPGDEVSHVRLGHGPGMGDYRNEQRLNWRLREPMALVGRAAAMVDRVPPVPSTRSRAAPSDRARRGPGT
jgi:hypothetical protein